jgi:hypothetical protein
MPCTGAEDCPGSSCVSRTCRGGENNRRPCAAASDCPDGTCQNLCQGGDKNARVCSVDDCPGGTCPADHELDFRARGECSFVLQQGRSLTAESGGIHIVARELTVNNSSKIGRSPSNALGNVRVQTAGPIQINSGGLQSAGRIDVSGPLAGAIFLATELGSPAPITINGVLDASTAAAQSDGGSIAVDAADVTVGANGRVNASGTGAGGDVSLSARRHLLVDGQILARGGEFGGGFVDLLASTGNVNLGTTGEVAVNGDSGAVLMDAAAGALTVRGTIDGQSAAVESCGADVDLSAMENVVVEIAAPKKINVQAPCGGALFVESRNGSVRMAGDIDARGTGTGFEGGDIMMHAPRGTLTVLSSLTTDGALGGPGINLFAGAVNVNAPARLSSSGTGGTNVLQACGLITVQDGAALAAGTRNLFEHRDAATPPRCGSGLCSAGGGNISPRPTIAVRANLGPCPAASTTTTSSTTTTTTTGGGGSSTTVTVSTSSSTTQGTGGSTTTTQATATSTTQATSASTSSTASTTTTTTNPTCAPSDCEDGDLCSDGQCTGGVCVQAFKQSFDAVSCKLDGAVNTINAAPDEAFSGTLKPKTLARIAKIRKLVDSRKTGSLKRAKKQIAATRRTLDKALAKGKVDKDVGQEIVRLLTGSVDALQPLITAQARRK